MNSHDNLLLVRILEWLAPLDRVFRLCRDGRTTRQSRYVTSHDCLGQHIALIARAGSGNGLTVHQDRLCDIIRIVSRHNMIHA